VDHDGHIELARNRQLAAEHPVLNVMGDVVSEVIEPGFPDRHATRMRRSFANDRLELIGPLIRAVGMEAGGGEDARFLEQGFDRGHLRRARPDRDDALDARGAGSCEHLAGIGVAAGDVGVSVDQD
jgi:hypothetical protein